MSKLELTAAANKRIITASVRDVVEFVLRTGDLGGGSHFAGPHRALEGTRAHQRYQKTRPASYQAEVTVSHAVEMPEFTFRLNGRIDGVHIENGALLVEEIKTVTRLDGLQPDPLHWAQGRIYAHLYAAANGFRAADVQLTYIELESARTLEFRQRHERDELAGFFDSVLAEYLGWIIEHQRWMAARDITIAALQFPFAFRRGQREMAVSVYRNIKSRGRLFVEAPTGIGKTLSVLFPAIKAIGEGHIEKIFYLTAKTIGRSVAEGSLSDLRHAGLKFRAVTITARDKVCFNSGEPCDVRNCPFAIGYYDRIKAALRDSLSGEELTRPQIEAVARKHQVCPFELSLDLSVWADGVICDYNYALDPSVSLKRFFSGEKRNFALLIDEAHNLVDRAREMFSAELRKDELLSLRAEIADDLPACARVLTRLNTRFLKLAKDDTWERRDGYLVGADRPEKVISLLREFCEKAESFLAMNEASTFRQPLLEFYFRALGFIRTADGYNESYRTLFESESGILRLFCLDPSSSLREVLADLGSTVFFSATLRPIEYYRESLGGEKSDPALTLESPFAPDALRLLLHHRVPTRLRTRALGYVEIAESIAALAAGRRGNYLVYFPSYDYLRAVLEEFRKRYPEVRTESQTTGMTESGREAFLNLFRTDNDQTMIAFAVLGGVFGEGIDLVGDRLIGVVIVGVGLPQLCLERDLIREYWQSRGQPGFDFAYTFPGMNRVLQAAGRVIRHESDRGFVLLLDERFARHPYPLLFPAWWLPQQVKSAEEILSTAKSFWDSGLVLRGQIPSAMQ